MAKLTTKFVKIPVKVDAKVLVGGKKKNANATGAGKSFKPVFQGFNRLGLTLESESNQLSESTDKLKAVNLGLTDFESKRKELNDLKSGYLDLVTKKSEEEKKSSKDKEEKGSTKPDPKIKKEVNKEGKPFGKGLLTLGKFLGGLKGLLSKAFFVTAGFAALKWFADPANAEKVDDIVSGLKSVFGFVWDVTKVVGGLVIGGIVNLGSGLGKIFGSGGDPKQILGGFGDILQALPGIATIGFLLNPIAAFKAIIRILTSWREPKQKEPEKPDKPREKPDKPDKPKKTPDKPEQPDKPQTPDKPKAPKKPKKPGFFQGIGDSLKKTGDSITSGARTVSKFAQDQGKRVAETGSRLVADLDRQLGGVIEAIGAGWKKLSEGTKAAITALQEKGGALVKKGQNAVFDWLSNQKGVLGKVGKALPDLLQKFGKYLPFVGDIAGFVFDIMAGVDWRRALIRAVVGASIDAGFTALMAAMGLAAPFTAGASGIAATALFVAYMGADLAVGGLGKVIGDPISDALGIPEMAGESSENATPGTLPSLESAEKLSADAIAAKDPDYLTKIAEKEGNTAEDGGILSPDGKMPLPFGAATTSKNKDDIRDLIGIGSSFDTNSVRGLLVQAIDQTKIFADTIFNMKENGIFEKGLNAVLNAGRNIAGALGSGLKEGKRQATRLLDAGRSLLGLEPTGVEGGWSPVLNLILKYEAGSLGYEAMYPSTKLPGATEMTIREVADKATGAVGAWQNLPEYLVGRAEAVGLDPDKDKYTPENQQKIAEYLIGPGQANVSKKMAKENPKEAMLRLSRVWAAIPKNDSGVSYYAGVGNNAAHIKPEMMYEAFQQLSSGGKVKQWQAKQKPVEISSNSPKNIATIEVPGWEEFSIGGEYQNGKLPKSVLRKVDAYGHGSVGHGMMHSSVAGQLQSLIDTAKTEGFTLGINSTYRSYQGQVDAKARYGNAAAAPGTSNHGWGKAVDFGAYSNDGYKWLWKNAGKFGFKPLSNWGLSPNTPDATEAWHWENLSGGGSKNDDVKTEPVDDTGDDTSDGSGGGPTKKGTDGGDKAAKKKPASMEEIFAKLAAAANKYQSIMGLGGGSGSDQGLNIEPSNADVPVAGIGPVADGDAYAKTLDGKSIGGEFDLTPTVDALKTTGQIFNLIPTAFVIPPSINPMFVSTSETVNTESIRVENIQTSISNLQINQTSNLIDKSRVVVAEKKSRKASPNIINTNSQTRQTVISGTNSFAVTAAAKHTKFF